MLFSSAVFGSRMFGGGSTIATVYSTDKLVFNMFSLSDGTNMVMEELLDSGPSVEIIGGSIPRGDGMYVTGKYFRERVIEASGHVKASTAAALDAYLDTIRKSLWGQEGNLDLIDANSTVKRFIATCDNFDEMFAGKQRYHTTICPFTARFICKTPFGKSRTYTSVYLALSTSPTNQSIVNSGTYKAQPIFVIIFSSATSITAVDVTNTTTGESITYTGSVSAGDVFVFDSEAKQVLKNGTAADYTGSFPTLGLGANVIATTVTGSSFAASMTTKWKPTYL